MAAKEEKYIKGKKSDLVARFDTSTTCLFSAS